MIKKLRTILNNSNYNIVESIDEIKVSWGNGSSYPEDYVEVKKHKNAVYDVLEVHRNDKKLIIENATEKDTISVTSVICKRLFEAKTGELSITRNLRQLIDNNDIEKGNDLLKQNLRTDVYSLMLEEENKVSLICHSEKADVKFHGKIIVENAKLSRSYVVLYNYAKYLMEFDNLYNQIEKVVGYSDKKGFLQDIYLFGM